MRARSSLLLIAASAALGGCAYGMGGYGSPLGGLSVGIGYGSGYGGYGSRYGGYDPFCHPYGYGGYGSYGRYGSYGTYGRHRGSYGYGYPYSSRYGGCVDPYWGWFGDYYYPGSGYYVYDRFRRPFRWSDAQRRYWTERRQKAETVVNSGNGTLRSNWDDFARHVNDKRLGRTSNEARSVQRQQVQRRSAVRQTERSTTSSTRERAAERRERRVQRDDTRPEKRDD